MCNCGCGAKLFQENGIFTCSKCGKVVLDCKCSKKRLEKALTKAKK